MDLKRLFDDDRAVSPVIGVILMVAITVILAAVIGTFVLGLGDQVQDTTPRASFGFSTETVSTQDGGSDTATLTSVSITHESGDTIADSNLDVSVNGNPAYGINPSGGSTDDAAQVPFDEGNDVSAGTTVEVSAYDTDTSTDTVSDGDAVTYNASGNIDSDTGSQKIATGDTVRVIYDSPDSDSSSTLAKFEVQ